MTAQPKWHGASTVEELDIADYLPLARKLGSKYASFFDDAEDAYHAAVIGLCKARDAWDPSRGPFQAIVTLFIRSELSASVDKELRRRGVPMRERKGGKYAIRRGRVYHVKPYEEVPVEVTSANVLNERGEPVDLFDAIPDDGTPPPDEAVDQVRLRARVAAVIETLDDDERDVALALLAGDMNGAGPRHIGRLLGTSRDRGEQVLRRLRDSLAGVAVDFDLINEDQVPAPKNRARRRLSDEQRTDALRLHQQGASKVEIGRRLGVDAVTIAGVIRRAATRDREGPGDEAA